MCDLYRLQQLVMSQLRGRGLTVPLARAVMEAVTYVMPLTAPVLLYGMVRRLEEEETFD